MPNKNIKQIIVPVILSGGSGSRLWPLSRELNPKQFLNLTSSNSMLQETLLRLEGCFKSTSPLIVCNEAHRFLVAEQLRQIKINKPTILLEPKGRNTAPAIAVSALQLQEQHKHNDSIMLVLPADHVISDIKKLNQTLEKGLIQAQQGKLVTFGITPKKAETAYGYIKKGMQHENNTYDVAAFKEKPTKDIAQTYIDSGDFLWNSGMFMFSCSSFLNELKLYQPEILKHAQQAIKQAQHDHDFIRLDRKAFLASPAKSIDYAIMEKTNDALVIPLDADWNDVGAWDSLWSISPKNNEGNVLIGDIITNDVSNTYIHADNKLVAAIGIDNCIIVETADAILVADKNKAQQVKQIVEQLKQENRHEALLHQQVYRPWGSYETLEEQGRFKVKRIIVNPKASLSLQMHHHRAEHWIVVHGTAKITQDEKIFTLHEDQSTYIPLGTKHSLENPGVIPLEIIEIQTGSYLGEDDIIRFSDVYGRTT